MLHTPHVISLSSCTITSRPSAYVLLPVGRPAAGWMTVVVLTAVGEEHPEFTAPGSTDWRLMLQDTSVLFGKKAKC
jgi:hypothetical protein